MRDECQPHGQPPAPPHGPLAIEPGDQRRKRQREQRQPEQGMGLGPVQHHVANGVAMVEDDIEVRQSAGHRTPGSGLPHGGSPAHDSDTDGSAQRNL